MRVSAFGTAALATLAFQSHGAGASPLLWEPAHLNGASVPAGLESQTNQDSIMAKPNLHPRAPIACDTSATDTARLAIECVAWPTSLATAYWAAMPRVRVQ